MRLEIRKMKVRRLLKSKANIRPLAKIARTGKMPIPLLAIFSCGVGVSPAPEFDEKDFCKKSILDPSSNL
jgi:hypothetical protein